MFFPKIPKIEIKRIAVSVITLIIMWLILLTVTFKTQGAELWIYKIILANTGFLNAHIVRKLAFPTIKNWGTKDQPYLKALVIALYIIFTYCFASGG